jgi:oligoribonuclease (3'-5' exoribonuclease)
MNEQLPTQINVLRAVSYDVSGIIESIKENEPYAEITIKSILDYIEDWVEADFGGLIKGLIYQDENGQEIEE